MNIVKVERRLTSRLAIATIATLLGCCLLAWWSANLNIYWLITSATMVSLLNPSIAFRQAIFCGILIALAFVSAENLRSMPIAFTIATCAIFSAGCYIVTSDLGIGRKFLLVIVFALYFLKSYFLPPTHDGFLAVLQSICVGSIIGLFMSQFFLLRKSDFFNLAMMKMFSTLQLLTTELAKALVSDNNEHNLSVIRQSVYADNYPDWVFATGFNPGLRAGFRYYLLNIDRILELFSSMEYLVTKEFNRFLPTSLRTTIAISLEKNLELLAFLQEYFFISSMKTPVKKFTLTQSASDYMQDIIQIEQEIAKILPGNLEFLEISQEYLYLMSFVRSLKDMREIILQLVVGLPKLS